MIRRLAITFFAIFALLGAGIVAFEQSRARRYRIEALTERLDAYSEQVAAGVGVFPPELRITLVARDGRVISENKASVDSMGNHLSRPEIAAALAHGHGTDIRTSTTDHHPYLYYARDGGSRIVRVALPYDGRVRSFLKPDNAFLYFVVGLFAVGLAFIWYVGSRFARAQQRLQHLEVRDRNRSLKRELTGNIAHELRTPVTSIRGFLEIVLGGGIDPERTQEYLQRAYNQTLGLSELISDMSLLTRLDERREGFPLSEVDVRKLLRRVQEDTGERLDARQIKFTAEIPDGLTVKANEGLLYSVFRNLTDNVAAHAGAGVEIRVHATVNNEFTFSDNGIGIPEEHLGRIFERFYRVGEGRTRDTGGSGLGLSIVRNAVALHGGEIRVRNLKPHGLEFSFRVG